MKQPGLVYRKRYTHRAVLRKRQQRLDAVIDALVDRLIGKHFKVPTDGKLQFKSRQP